MSKNCVHYDSFHDLKNSLKHPTKWKEKFKTTRKSQNWNILKIPKRKSHLHNFELEKP